MKLSPNGNKQAADLLKRCGSRGWNEWLGRYRAVCGEETARGFWSKLPINECVEMMPEVEPGLNKAKIKVDVTLLVCVDFASLFCGLGKKNCGQRGDLFWREMFHKSVRPRPTGFVDVFDEINLFFADTRTLILNRMIALRSKTVAHTSLKVVEIQKFCYHGNMSSHSPLLLRLCSKKNWRGPSASTASSIIRVVFWVIFGSLRFCSVVQCSQAGIYCFVWTEMKNFVLFSIILYMRHQNVHDTALLHDKNCYNR